MHPGVNSSLTSDLRLELSRAAHCLGTLRVKATQDNVIGVNHDKLVKR